MAERIEKMDIIKELNRIKIDKHKCLGCGYEHNCAIRGCAIINQAIDILEKTAIKKCENCQYSLFEKRPAAYVCCNYSSNSCGNFVNEDFICDKWKPISNETTFGFDKAITYIKLGLKLRRKAWDCKEQYVQLTKNIPDTLKNEVEIDDTNNNSIAFVGICIIKTNWTPSQIDMLAEDWCFAGEENEKDKI